MGAGGRDREGKIEHEVIAPLALHGALGGHEEVGHVESLGHDVRGVLTQGGNHFPLAVVGDDVGAIDLPVSITIVRYIGVCYLCVYAFLFIIGN